MIAVDSGTDVTDPEFAASLEARIPGYIYATYTDEGRPAPGKIEAQPTEWVVSNSLETFEDMAEVDKDPRWQASVDQLQAYMREHPGEFVAVGIVRYTEIWDE